MYHSSGTYSFDKYGHSALFEGPILMMRSICLGKLEPERTSHISTFYILRLYIKESCAAEAKVKCQHVEQ